MDIPVWTWSQCPVCNQGAKSLQICCAALSPCQIFLNKCPNLRKKLLVPCVLDPPSASCYVCVSKPEATVKLDVHKTTILSLQDRVGPPPVRLLDSQLGC